MKIEVDGVIYKVNFSHAQIEITGCCNMNCKHCRAVNEAPMFMSLDKIKMILDFASQNSNKEFNLVISGVWLKLNIFTQHNKKNIEFLTMFFFVG